MLYCLYTSSSGPLCNQALECCMHARNDVLARARSQILKKVELGAGRGRGAGGYELRIRSVLKGKRFAATLMARFQKDGNRPVGHL